MGFCFPDPKPPAATPINVKVEAPGVQTDPRVIQRLDTIVQLLKELIGTPYTPKVVFANVAVSATEISQEVATPNRIHVLRVYSTPATATTQIKVKLDDTELVFASSGPHMTDFMPMKPMTKVTVTSTATEAGGIWVDIL